MRIALAIPFLVVLGACSGVFLMSGTGAEARFRHRELGYEIAYPDVLSEPGWSIQRLAEADLVISHPEGSIWALASTCRASNAGLRVLTGELARATGGHVLGPGISLQQAGLEGLSQRLERVGEGRRLQIKTVTLRGARCTYDWVLIAPSPGRLSALERRFDEWWGSFERGPKESPAEGSPPPAEGSLPPAEGSPPPAEGSDG